MAWDDTASKVWMDGELVDWKDATIHSLSHVPPLPEQMELVKGALGAADQGHILS